MKTASAARDAGLAKTAKRNPDFMADGLEAIRGLPPDEYQGESIRVLLLAQKAVEPPSSSNAWGALIRAAIREGVLKKTGRWAATREIKTHGHPTEIYVKE